MEIILNYKQYDDKNVSTADDFLFLFNTPSSTFIYAEGNLFLIPDKNKNKTNS